MKTYLILTILVIVLASCKKYEVQYGTETAETTAKQGDVYEIAYCTEDGVFLITGGMNRSKMLVSFANKRYAEGKPVALSLKKDKVAYIDPDNGAPVIVDTAGNVLEELTQYTNTNDLGWYNGNQTLYILSNNQVHFYGEALNLPNPLFVPPSGSNDYEVTSLDINKNLDVAYGAIYYKEPGSYRNWYYSYNLNYNSPTSVDKSEAKAYGSYHFFQNVWADSKRYYHTIKFSDPRYTSGVEQVVKAYATKTQSGKMFSEDYIIRKNNYELSIDHDGVIFKKPVDSYSGINSAAGLWNVALDYDEPFYVDWAIGF